MAFPYDGILDDLGMANFTEDLREKARAIIQEEFEMRVGADLCSGMEGWKVNEYSAIIADVGQGQRWLDENEPEYHKSAMYKLLASRGLEGPELIAMASSTLWLERNCPDYEKVVCECRKQIWCELNRYQQFISPRL
ncbi:MAG: DUF5663 domain-containing protein [Oscillospiraceae bacterium]|jgi:hypothetical protein|nr:DUF5663 domain-containing protein [Oscillospiraceae bacterium]